MVETYRYETRCIQRSLNGHWHNRADMSAKRGARRHGRRRPYTAPYPPAARVSIHPHRLRTSTYHVLVRFASRQVLKQYCRIRHRYLGDHGAVEGTSRLRERRHHIFRGPAERKCQWRPMVSARSDEGRTGLFFKLGGHIQPKYLAVGDLQSLGMRASRSHRTRRIFRLKLPSTPLVEV